MSIIIHCPFCDQKYEIEETQIGAIATCQKCGKEFAVEKPLTGIQSTARNVPNAKSIPETSKVQRQTLPPKTGVKVNPTAHQSETITNIHKQFLVIGYICCTLLALSALLILTNVTEKTAYSYSVKEIEGYAYNLREPEARKFNVSDISDTLNSNDEVLAVIPITETILKNYGNDEYVTGLRTHTRTSRVIIISRKCMKIKFYQAGYWNNDHID